MVVVKSLPKIPTVDLSKDNLKPGTSLWHTTRNDVRRALEEYGCFVALYDKVSHQLHTSIFSTELKQLFDLPTDTKMKNVSAKPYFGYVGNQPFIPPLHESLGIENATTLEAAESFTDLMWPNDGNDRFRETVLLYSRLVSELEKIVKRMVFESYGVEKYYDSHVGSTSFLLRLIKYRVPELNESSIGSEAHTDMSFISILHQNEVNGLEIETADGDWIGFDASPSSFLVLAGEAFLAWSNGRVHSASHRVVMRGTKPRYSVALFSFHNGTIEIPGELVDEQHPVQFKPFDHYGLLHHFQADPTIQSTAKAYCGV